MKITEQIKQFMRLMHEYREYGTTDSEPQSAFYALLESSFLGNDFDENLGPEYWELYSSMDNSEEVANELTAKYKELHHAIQEAPHKEIIEASNYFGIEY